MAGDVITLSAGCAAILPLASEAEVVCTLATDVVVAQMVVKSFGIREGLRAFHPETFVCRLWLRGLRNAVRRLRRVRFRGLGTLGVGGRGVRRRGRGREGGGHVCVMVVVGEEEWRQRGLGRDLRIEVGHC